MQRTILISLILTSTLALFAAADVLSSILNKAVEDLSQTLPEADIQQALVQIRLKASAIDMLARDNTSRPPSLLTLKQNASVACEICNTLFPPGYVGPNSITLLKKKMLNGEYHCDSDSFDFCNNDQILITTALQVI